MAELSGFWSFGSTMKFYVSLKGENYLISSYPPFSYLIKSIFYAIFFPELKGLNPYS